MNKKVLVIVAAFVVVAFLASSIAPISADTVRVDYYVAGGNAIIDVEGQTMIRLVAAGMWSSDFGKADRLSINVWTGSGWRTNVVAYEDDPERILFSTEDLATGTVTHLVKPGHIQILRIGKSNNMIIHWTIPLVAPATATTPEVVLPPGLVVLRGVGDALPPGHTGPYPIGPNGWWFEIETPSRYDADAFLFCQGWDVKWEQVGGDYSGPGAGCRVVTERTWTWWLPSP